MAARTVYVTDPKTGKRYGPYTYGTGSGKSKRGIGKRGSSAGEKRAIKQFNKDIGPQKGKAFLSGVASAAGGIATSVALNKFGVNSLVSSISGSIVANTLRVNMNETRNLNQASKLKKTGMSTKDISVLQNKNALKEGLSQFGGQALTGAAYTTAKLVKMYKTDPVFNRYAKDLANAVSNKAAQKIGPENISKAGQSLKNTASNIRQTKTNIRRKVATKVERTKRGLNKNYVKKGYFNEDYLKDVVVNTPSKMETIKLLPSNLPRL